MPPAGMRFEKSAAQINQQADEYLKAGNFATTSISGRAIRRRDFKNLCKLGPAGRIGLSWPTC